MKQSGHGITTSRLRARSRRFWRRLFRNANDDRGAAALEFAMVLPVLLIVLLGVIQFGFIFFMQITMTNAVREAARQLAVGEVSVGNVSDCASAAAGTAEDIVCGFLGDGSGFTITACDPDNADALCSGDDVAVRASIPMIEISLADMLGLFKSGNMVTTVTMRKES